MFCVCWVGISAPYHYAVLIAMHIQQNIMSIKEHMNYDNMTIYLLKQGMIYT